MQIVKTIISWVLSLWIAKIFLTSLPYKFSMHPDTQHIFGTIGIWLGDVTTIPFLGVAFASYGPYVIGAGELLTSLFLLFPIVLTILHKTNLIKVSDPYAAANLQGIGGWTAAKIMSGAIFFHLVTPLGVEVLHQGQPDGGALFWSGVSVFVSGVILVILNFKPSMRFLVATPPWSWIGFIRRWAK